MRDRVHPILPFPFMVCFAAAACDSGEVVVGSDAGTDATPAGSDAGTDAAPADGAPVGEGHCHYNDWDGGWIACEAGSSCFAGGETRPDLECRPDPGAPLNCGVIGCAWDCKCVNVPLAECACALLTSTASAKRDIEYVDASAEARLHDELMAVRLATYRYRPGVTGEDNLHLGFIIEDMPPDSPAVLPSRERVDAYGYLSMAVAALKVQERELTELRARVAQLEAHQGMSAAARVDPSG
jgi:hypothetical protein